MCEKIGLSEIQGVLFLTKNVTEAIYIYSFTV